MKILYVCSTDKIYGDNKALLNLMPYLKEFGVIPIFLTRTNSDFFKYLKVHGYQVYSYQGFYAHAIASDNKMKALAWFVKTNVMQKFVKFDREFYALEKSLKAEKIDLVHTNNGICTLGYRLAKALHTPHIWHIREYIDRDANFMFMPNKWSYSRDLKNSINYKITITDGVKDHFHLTERTLTIYDGALMEECMKPVLPKKEDYFLYVGRLTQGKCVHDAVESFITYKDSFKTDTKLYIVGDGSPEYTKLLKDAVSRSNCSSDICFLGYRTDVQDLMRKAKALVVPSQFEAFGFITAEAMFNGCPVIGRDTGGTKEQMDNVDKQMNQTVCYRFSNQKELVERMNELSTNPTDVAVLQDIQMIVSKLYSAKTSASKVSELYLNILEKRL